jgi:sugar phosphate isomerase/epimerase
MSHKLSIAAERVTGEDEFERYLELARQRDLGIEIQEFYLPDLMWGDWRARLDEYQRLLADFKGNLSIHNAFYSLDHFGLDPRVLALTQKKYDFIFMIARELGCKQIVSHFVWNPFIRGDWLIRWQEAEVKFWEPYVNRAAEEGIVLVGENTSEPRPDYIKAIVDKIDSDHFKFVLDVGHAHLFSESPLADWITTFGDDLAYMHLHNNDGITDQHNPLHKGTIDFDAIFQTLDQAGIAPILTTEIYDPGLPESLDYLQEKMALSQVYASQAAG